jgi:hypothetical protein
MACIRCDRSHGTHESGEHCTEVSGSKNLHFAPRMYRNRSRRESGRSNSLLLTHLMPEHEA